MTTKAKVLKIDGSQARARRDLAAAKQIELRTAVAAGKLLDAEEVDTAWAAEVAAVRAHLLSWAVALAPKLFRTATLEDEAAVGRALEAGVREALTELGQGRHVKPAPKPAAATSKRKVRRRA